MCITACMCCAAILALLIVVAIGHSGSIRVSKMRAAMHALLLSTSKSLLVAARCDARRAPTGRSESAKETSRRTIPRGVAIHARASRGGGRTRFSRERSRVARSIGRSRAVVERASFSRGGRARRRDRRRGALASGKKGFDRSSRIFHQIARASGDPRRATRRLSFG